MGQPTNEEPVELAELRERLREIRDLRAIGSVLIWDQSTYMPPGGADARGRHIALTHRLAHSKQIDAALAGLIDKLRGWSDKLPADDRRRAMIDVAHRDYVRAICLPEEFVAALSEHQATTYEVWKLARPRNDFAQVVPYLERTLELSRQLAAYFPHVAHPADALMQEEDYGVTVAIVRPLFAALRQRLQPLVEAVCNRPSPRDDFLYRHYPIADQIAFGEDVIRHMGYDFQRGRQDETHHPFMIRFSSGDIRITTRLREDDLTRGLYGTIHEAGHALYEQGIDPELDGTPLATGTSVSMHESQSRMWENVVARGLPFWRYFFPKLQARFPEQLEDVSLDELHRAVNKVGRTLIRVEADELTYNLHGMLRCELECSLLEGKLAVRDLADAWNAGMDDLLGTRPPDDRDGVLQDIHWYGGTFGGMFHCYTLGNVICGQLVDAARRALPALDQQIESGDFSTLLNWVRREVHVVGRAVDTYELVQRATGAPLTIEPYWRYLSEKYGELYGLAAGSPHAAEANALSAPGAQ